VSIYNCPLLVSSPFACLIITQRKMLNEGLKSAIPGKAEPVLGNLVTLGYFGEKKQAYNELDFLRSDDFIYAQLILAVADNSFLNYHICKSKQTLHGATIFKAKR